MGTGLRAWLLHTGPREPPEPAKRHLLGWQPGHREATGDVRCLPRRWQLLVPESISVDRSESAPHKGNSRGGSEVLGAREMERTRKSSGSSSPAIQPQL